MKQARLIYQSTELPGSNPSHQLFVVQDANAMQQLVGDGVWGGDESVSWGVHDCVRQRADHYTQGAVSLGRGAHTVCSQTCSAGKPSRSMG